MADDKIQQKKPTSPRPQQFSAQKPAQESKFGPDYKHIVRIANTDLKGEKQIHMALHKIRGVSFMFSNFVCHSAKIDPRKVAGTITTEEIQKLEDVIRNPAKYNCPVWLLNRRKDYETGQDMHLITTDWDLSVDNDLKRMKKVKSYKGIRHMLGQPVRGQRTKSNFRKNKGKVSLGVVRKATAPPPSDKGDKKK
jgi:small subunit ribosomal protein S13